MASSPLALRALSELLLGLCLLLTALLVLLVLTATSSLPLQAAPVYHALEDPLATLVQEKSLIVLL